MKTVVVIPTYNEKENVTGLLHQICNLPIPDLGVLVVDDNSPDGTAAAVETIKTDHPGKIFLLQRPGKLGLGSAYVAGMTWALQQAAEIIFEMDADGSHDPNDIPRLIEPIKTQQADVVLGSRRIKGGQITGWNLSRHLASWGAMAATRLILGLKTHDVTAGFRAYRSQVLEGLGLERIKTNGYAFQEETIWLCERQGWRIQEIPITFKDREKGQSKLNHRDIFEFFTALIRLKIRQLASKY